MLMKEENIYSELVFNVMLDWRKREIDKFKRAVLIKEYLQTHNMSQRKLAEQLGISKSNIEDWLLYNRLTQKEYQSMRDNGLSDRDIYRALRDNKKVPKEQIISITKLDYDIEDARKKLHKYITDNLPKSFETQQRIKELINVLNRILMRIEE